jgi:hypothetical protein
MNTVVLAGLYVAALVAIVLLDFSLVVRRTCQKSLADHGPGRALAFARTASWRSFGVVLVGAHRQGIQITTPFGGNYLVPYSQAFIPSAIDGTIITAYGVSVRTIRLQLGIVSVYVYVGTRTVSAVEKYKSLQTVH